MTKTRDVVSETQYDGVQDQNPTDENLRPTDDGHPRQRYLIQARSHPDASAG